MRPHMAAQPQPAVAAANRMKPEVSIVIPTFNEAENLPVLIEGLRQALANRPEHYELIVVDDDSPDGTWRLAESLRSRYPQLRVIRRITGARGLAPAVVAGWQAAQGDLFGVMDADLQHPPEALSRLLDVLRDGSVDLAIASRYVSNGHRLRWNPVRKWISRGASNLAQAVLPPQAAHVTDPMSGFFLLRRRVIERVALQPKGYKILLEVLSRGHYAWIKEIPYQFGRRHRGQSKLGAQVMRDYLAQLWRLMWVPTGFGRFLRYSVVGSTGVLVNMGILWWLRSSGLLGTLRAGAVAIECSIVNNFLWNELWTFRDRSRISPQLRRRLWRFAHFNLVCGAGALLNLGMLWAFAIRLRWNYLLANAVGIGLVTLWNYGLNTTWTWAQITPPSPDITPPRAVPREAGVVRTVRRPWRWVDVMIPSALAAAAFTGSLAGAQRIPPWVVQNYGFIDEWFEADSPRVVEDMTNHLGPQKATVQHPLFPLMTYPAVKALQVMGGLDPLAAVRVVIAGIAAVWIIALFLLLRLMGCRRADATLFSMLAGVSASAMFGFVVPETWPLGSLTILVAVGTVAWAGRRALSPAWHVLANVLTLSATLTNWMAGLLATFVQYPWRRALQIALNGFCLVVLLWWAQKLVFPQARFFLRERVNTTWVMQPESAKPLRVVNAFLLHPMVMPAIKEVEQRDRPWSRMTVQPSRPGSGTRWGAVAVWLWVSLLALGAWGLQGRLRGPDRRLPMVLGLLLLGQLALHLVYGAEETFLYSLHWMPLLVILAAFGTLTRARPVAVALAGALMLCAGTNNVLQLDKAAAFVQSRMTPAQAVRRAMADRPGDPWPRRSGHVLLALPGSPVNAKAYHEPGGSFSPGVGSFGVSIWITDQHGTVWTTSDTMPLSLIHQRVIATDASGAPSVVTDSAYYQARWSARGSGQWVLDLQPSALPEVIPVVALRSVGPAGGAISSLDWDGHRLLVNGRYVVTINPPPAAVHLGEEGPKGWMADRSLLTQWHGEDGWGYARFELTTGRASQVTIQDTAVMPRPGVDLRAVQSTIEADLPDPQFTASLQAQIAHLLMGLVDRETRPGDPMSASDERRREGAYVIAALARAGQLSVAKEFAAHLLADDVAGSAPIEPGEQGLVLWALEEVAAKLHDPAYDQWAWPHVRRNAELIVAQAAAAQRKPQSAKDALFVAAMSYRGLLDAAALAERINQPTDAEQWRAAAAQWQGTWLASFKRRKSQNEMTSISGMWPSWVASPDAGRFLQRLEARWRAFHDAEGNFSFDGVPYTLVRPSLEVGEAHQWLWLGRSDRVWATLGWLWQHQSSPGLYTWWEGKEVAFEQVGQFQRRWERVRGWVDRPQVTPSYWTAAEVLLLQLDMLAYADESGSEPILVIGAGIPAAWLAQPMSARGISTRLGIVDWRWKDGRMDVTLHPVPARWNKVHRTPCRVRLGPAFDSGTPVQVSVRGPA